MKKIILIISFLFIISGCYDHKELNDLAVISGIDISKSKDKYNINIQVINTNNKDKENNKDNNEFIIYDGVGDSINMAIDDIINKVPKKLYEPQIQVLTIDENIAKNNLKEVLDFFIRNNEFRGEFYVLISKRDKDNLSIIKKIDAKDIVDTMKNNNNNIGIISLITLNDLIDNYQNNNKEITLPVIEEVNNNSNHLNILSLGIFKDNKLVGLLNKEEAKAYNLVMNNINNTLITTKYNNSEYIISQLIKPKSKIDLKLNKKIININIKGLAIIRENNCNLNLEDKDNISKIENELNNSIEKLIKNNINKINKKYNSDIYGFKDLIYKYHKNYYKDIIKKDKNYLNNIDIEVNSNISIINDGNLLGGIDNE